LANVFVSKFTLISCF